MGTIQCYGFPRYLHTSRRAIHLTRNLLTAVGPERGPLILVSTSEELLDRKVAAPVYKTENTAGGIHHADHVAPYIRKSWQSLRRQAAVARSV
jgi:hypothetical protein